MEKTAQSLNIELLPFRLQTPSELMSAFERMEQMHVEAVETGEDPLSIGNVGASTPHDLDLRGWFFLILWVPNGALPAMSPNARYRTLHWIRVALWPVPVLTLFRAGRAALNLMRR